MSAATATAASAAPPAKGKKKLILIVAIAVLVLAAGGGAAMLLLKKKPVDTEDGDEHPPAKPVAAVSKHDPHVVPMFVPLDPFTVNLADRDAERYAQVGVTLEIDDAKTGEQIKAYMPAIRNRILMAIADRSAGELLGREGKSKLAERIKRETSVALGFEVEADGDGDSAADDDEHAKPGAASKKKKSKKKAPPLLPVRAVHFSNFIIQ